MFEFMYAKKIREDMIMEIIDKYKDDYYVNITYKPNGNMEIFIGSEREIYKTDGEWQYGINKNS